MPETPHNQPKKQSESDAPALPRRLRSALEKAAGYRAEQRAASSEDESKVEKSLRADEDVRRMEEWGDIVSQRIEDAIRQGMFDNLPGHGKPLNLDRDPFLPEDQQMAATLLRNNNLSPAWISERSVILDAIGSLRAELQRTVSFMRSALTSAENHAEIDELRIQWTSWLGDWRSRMDKLNDRILVHNLKQPVAHLEILMLDLGTDLKRAGADPTWTDNISDV